MFSTCETSAIKIQVEKCNMSQTLLFTKRPFLLMTHYCHIRSNQRFEYFILNNKTSFLKKNIYKKKLKNYLC